MNIALILAGGTGERSGESIPKQFVEINGKPLIIFTLEKFQQCRQVDRIVIVCLKDWIGRLEGYVRTFGMTKVTGIAEGGRNGLESVKHGIDALSGCAGDDLILIHDAVRPFVDIESIEDNIRVAKEHGMALTSIDLVETLVYSEDGISAERIVDRDKLKRILTPQTFSYSVLKELYSDTDKLDPQKYPSTFSLYMAAGKKVYCSKGNEKNVKITYSDDLEFFRNLFG